MRDVLRKTIILLITTFFTINSKEHIFDPLGMKASFLLTPDLKERAVNLAFRDEKGTLHPSAGQLKIIEQDPTKGM